MTFICIICNEKLGQNFNSDQNDDPDAILATFCGHLYHQSCLYQSISIRKRSQRDLQEKPCSKCPSCNKVIDQRKLMQIFPAEESYTEINNEIANLVSEKNALKFEVGRLKEELKRTEILVREASDIANFEHGQKENNPPGKKSPLREKQIVSLKSTRKGLKIGSHVMWLQNKAEEGVIKWLGTIDGIIAAGIELVNPVGNNFPETNGMILFNAKLNHGRIVPIKDLMLYSEFHQHSISIEFSHLQNGDISIDNERQLLETTREKYQNVTMAIDLWFETIVPKIGKIGSENIFGDTVTINEQLERAKNFEKDILKKKTLFLEMKEISKILSESLSVPLYEKCEIDQKLAETNENYVHVEAAVASLLSNLTMAFFCAQKCEDLISARLKSLCDTKSQLRNMGKNLIMNEFQLSELISELASIQNSFLTQKKGELSYSELFVAINEFRKYGTRTEKFEASTKEIISGHNQLLEDLEIKFSTLNKTKILYKQFITYTTMFEEWYDYYMSKMTTAHSTDHDGDGKLLHLFQEKDEKRQELVKILESAKELRVSIFDSSVLDDKIESLQCKWKSLLERATELRRRARKTF